MALLEIFDPKAAPRAIGIDLGTTNSLVAYVSNGRPVTIADCNSVVLVPSVVSYAATGDPVVGQAAIERAAEHPRDTIASVKRMMGRGADDPETQRLTPYDFAPARADQPNAVRFRVAGGRIVTPVDVSADILRTLKARAHEEVGAVGGAVVTVPAYFDDAQRQATKDAARLAGLEVLRLLNEPTAAALAYGLERNRRGTFAVYDLGGGTFDVTVLVLDDGVFQVRSTGGDSQLGGDDMDRCIAQFALADLAIASDAQSPALIRWVLDEARRAKHALTTSDAYEVEIPGHGVSVIRRNRFEEGIRPLLERTGRTCRRALADAGMAAADLDGVILVGGSTRVPAVRRYVAELFGREPLGDIDPDQVVALGAAIQADLLAQPGRADDVLLLDVTPLSLGIEVGGGIVDKILPRNSTVPCAARATYTTQEDHQTGFEVHVVQGERELVADNRSLARFTLKGIPPLAAGLARLEVTFRVDADGLLAVHARETTTGLEQHVTVKPTYGLDDATVERMLMDALDHGHEDLARRKLAESRVEGHRILSATRRALDTDADLLSAEENATVALACAALERTIGGEQASAIALEIDALDRATQTFAARRMNRAMARAIGGRRVDSVEKAVEHAKGIEYAHGPGPTPGQVA